MTRPDPLIDGCPHCHAPANAFWCVRETLVRRDDTGEYSGESRREWRCRSCGWLYLKRSTVAPADTIAELRGER